MQQPATIATIVKRNGNLVSYDRERITNAIFKATTSTGTPDRTLAESLAAQVENTLTEAYHGEMLPSVEDIQDIVEKTLIENHQIKLAHNYITYRSQRAMRRATRAFTFEVTDNIPYKKIYEVLLWNMAHRCESVEALNEHIQKGSFSALVRASEDRFSGEIHLASEAILARGDATRLIIISGPSSSGKTTTTIKIGEALNTVGKKLKAINIDNYFFDLEKHPRDEFGDYDYETPQALNLALINHHLAELLAGRTIKTPFYNFKTGKSTLNVQEMHLEDNEILLLDSLHGLYGGMTKAVPASHKFRLYVETLGQLRAMDGTFMRWADNRLLRRMIRDKAHRNLQPMGTLTHWHYVRRSELKYIIPFIGEVDFLVNTALPFELPLLKARLWEYLPQAMTLFQTDPRRQDAYVRAKRVHDLLAPIEAVSQDSMVPATSLLREFIGGSQYNY
ncbi:MAG: ATP cone domain-containing protein [bacterium]|jgi:uridine kinase